MKNKFENTKERKKQKINRTTRQQEITETYQYRNLNIKLNFAELWKIGTFKCNFPSRSTKTL